MPMSSQIGAEVGRRTGMKAAVFHELGKPLGVETVARPQAGPGEIVLKVHYCGDLRLRPACDAARRLRRPRRHDPRP